MPNLGTLTLDLIAKVGGFTRPLDKAGRHHKKTARQIAREQKKMREDFKKTMASMGKWGAAMAAAAAAGAVAMTRASLKTADEIGKVAATAAISTDTLQEMRHAAVLSGISFNDLDKGMQAFNKRIGELRAGTGALYTYLVKTDKGLLSQLKTLESTDDALDLMFDSMQRLTNASDRAALSSAGFGRSGQRLVILADQYKELRKEARDLGLVIDESLIKNAEKTNDQIATLSAMIKTQLMSGLLELAPYIQEIVTDMTEWVKNNKDFLAQDLPGYIRETGKSVRGFVDSPAFEAFKEYWEIIAGAAAGFAAAGPMGALYGAGAGAGVSIYRDLSEYFDESLPKKIRRVKEELADLELDAKYWREYANKRESLSSIREREARKTALMQELAGYEKIVKAQQDIIAKAKAKAQAEKDAAEAIRMQAVAYDRLAVGMNSLAGISLNFEVTKVQREITDAEILGESKVPFTSGAEKANKAELEAKREYLRQLLVLQELEAAARAKRLKKLVVQQKKEAAELAKHNEQIIGLDREVQKQLELIGLSGYQRQLRALEQNQAEELEKYRKAGADIIALQKLHAEQRKALKADAARELLSSFADAPSFVGTGGEAGELGMLEQQREDLARWYTEQKKLLEQYRQERADLNEKWNEKERQVEAQHSERLARIQQARTQLILTSNASLFQSLADIQATFASEQNSTYKALFAISKAFTIAETTLNMYNAISDAWAVGATVADKVAAASMVASGMLTIIQSAKAVGMAHDGIDSVPETGTWLLQKGERVVAERTSKRLDDTLSRLQSGGWNVNIHEAPGTSAQVIRRQDGLDVQIAVIEEQLMERMGRGTGMAAVLDRRYGKRG